MSPGTPPSVPPAHRWPVGIDRALVVGLGVSGRAAALLLAELGVAVTAVDEQAAIDPRPGGREPDGLGQLRDRGVEVVLGRAASEHLGPGIDLVVPSPGVPESAPVLRGALAAGIPVWSEPELALRAHPRRLLGVTGTNGKTSTTELLGEMLRGLPQAVVVCGNIGTPVSAAVAGSPEDAVLVAELSSFQLRFAGTLRPEVGVLLNLAPDHLDWHPDLAAYGAAKARLWEAQGPGDWAVANADDELALALLGRHAPGRQATFSATRAVEPGVGVEGGWLVASLPDVDGDTRRALAALEELPAAGAPHLVANTAAAACAALLAGADADQVVAAARRYRPGRHRLELVARDPRGVRYLDDSKATNVHAAVAALRAVGPCVWIAGGLAKGVDLTPLAAELGGVHDAVLIGAAADELARVCASAGVPHHRAASIEEAVELATRLARPGDAVLLAPACASFDQFASYAERGARFSAAAVAMIGAPADGPVDRSEGGATR